MLTINERRRGFERDGKPFFYLRDTAPSLTPNLRFRALKAAWGLNFFVKNLNFALA